MNESQVIKALSALAQETRLQIIRYLVACGKDGAAAGTIGEEVNSSASRLSFHLNILENAGLVTSKRVSRRIFYSASYEQMGGMIGYLLEDCCGNHPEVTSCCMPGTSNIS
ncbi:MAG: winged helix-turn-helix transcriptional regulator [Sneathiella sp.]|nr:winged helix-turn-helix transcriptional regulator [Sneathiella sp.]